jgi:serine/threonine protein kinase
MTLGASGDLIDDRYQLIALLGQGGFGEVWRALDRHRNYEIALKLLRAGDRRGAWREASILTALRSPHILEVNNADIFVDVPYLDTALARRSLDQVAKGIGIEPHRAVECMRRALRGLELCHTRRLLHRDVKPANLFEDFNGDVRLGDFGAAEIMDEHDTAAQAGDPRVRAPETYTGGRYTVRSDIYGSAVTLYFLLAGRWPFDQNVAADLDRAIQEGDTPNLRDLAPHVSLGLSRIVARGMSLNHASRFATAAAFDSALGSLPARARRFDPIVAHPGHLRCWEAHGNSSDLSICTQPDTRAVAIEVTHSSSGRRLREHCGSEPTARVDTALRRLFDRLR